MYNETLAKRGIKTAGPKKSNNDLILPPIDAHKNKPKPASKLSKIGAKKVSICSRTDKMGSGLS